MPRDSSMLFAVAACALALAGCGSSGSSSSSGASAAAGHASPSTSANVAFAKTKFALHAGLALGAFHHFILRPFEGGELRHPLLHKAALIKAALAGLFAFHELKLAAQDVRSSKPLSALFAPLTNAAAKLKAFKVSLASGRASAPRVETLKSELDTIEATAASDGSAINEAVPSLAQLARGTA